MSEAILRTLCGCERRAEIEPHVQLVTVLIKAEVPPRSDIASWPQVGERDFALTGEENGVRVFTERVTK